MNSFQKKILVEELLTFDGILWSEEILERLHLFTHSIKYINLPTMSFKKINIKWCIM